MVRMKRARLAVAGRPPDRVACEPVVDDPLETESAPAPAVGGGVRGSETFRRNLHRCRVDFEGSAKRVPSAQSLRT